MSDRLRGVSLEVHAGISAALAEGFSLAEILAQEGLTAVAFRRADIAWKKRLTEDARQQGPTWTAHCARRQEAEEHLRRDVAPLDTDLAAWVGFCKHLGAGEPTSDVLDRWGLRLSDVARIGRAWQKRLQQDTKLAARAAELQSTAAPPARILVGEAVLRPFPWSRPAEAPAPAPRSNAAAAAIRETPSLPPTPEGSAPPPVSVPAVPSYLRPDAQRLAPTPPRDSPPPAPPETTPRPAPKSATVEGFVLPRRKTLPFARPPHAPPGLPLSLEDHAAMTLELVLWPARISEVLQLTGLDPATKARLDQYVAALRRSSPEAGAAWEAAYRAAWTRWAHVPWPGPARVEPRR